MKSRTFKLLAMVITVVMLIVSMPISSLAASVEDFEEIFSYTPGTFDLADWTGQNNTPALSDGNLRVSQTSDQNYATITYKNNYNLTNGFELTYSANVRTSYNNIYSGYYYVGVKIGNITVAMDQYVKPTILINDKRKALGSAIISYSSASDIASWLTNTESKYSSVYYKVSYDPDTKKVTYAKYHDDVEVFKLVYTDTAKLVNLEGASIALYHNNSRGLYATYSNFSLLADLGIPDTTGMPGGKCGENANWAFDEASGTLYITGSGAMDNYINVGNVAPWSAEYRKSITKVVVADGITHIGNRAFKGHNRITTVKLGKGVKTLGYECFYLCNKLEKIKLNNGLTNLGALTFYNCTALTQITIPSSVTNIENRAFKGSGLTSIVVPDTVTKMGYEVFMNCASLAELDFTESLSMLQPCTFMNCTSLTQFYFTDNMCRIRANAFNGCTSLKSVEFENEAMMWASSNGNEAKIASNAFEGCSEELELLATKGGHVESYAAKYDLIFADKNATAIVYDLTALADSATALKNPDKGWYIHYYDNTLSKYGNGLSAKDAVAMIPCLDHIYLRLAWSYLEPREGQFNWNVIDKVINDYAQYGIKVSFRITCKETDASNKYATPQWVKNAGAAGTLRDDSWEPDYGDPIFLQKLDNFHKAFAERYDSREDVIYVDVGSYGDWGEGHTSSSSQKVWGWDTIKAHFDIYKKYYKNTQIVISDDFVGGRSASNGRDDIKQYVLDNGWTYRDDSVGVEWYVNNYGEKLRSPELFKAVKDTVPTIIENEHYGWNKECGNWQNGKYFLSAMEQTSATYGGFHGYPADFMKDNPEVAKQIGNKLGYWYFVNGFKLSSNSKNMKLEINWLNQGASKAYNKYDLSIILVDSSKKEYVFNQADFDNTQILPNQEYVSKHAISKQGLSKGTYTLKIAMKKGDEIVQLALNSGNNGVYTLGQIVVD